MLTEAEIPGTDDWYLVTLAKELGQGFPRLKRLDSYSDGSIVVPENADAAVKEAYRKFIKKANLTLADLIVQQTTGRKNIRGFRTGASGDANGDMVAAKAYRANNLGVLFRDLFNDEGTYGTAMTIVGKDAFGLPFVKIANEWTCKVMPNALRPWIADAAIIVGWDPIGQQDMITLIRPGTMRVAVKPTTASTIPQNGSVWTPGTDWTWTTAPIALGFTEGVPVSVFQGPRGVGEFENHTDTLDRIHETILQRITITAMQAFRQRALTPDKEGAPLPEEYPEGHELAGEKINYDEVFKGGPAALWFLPAGAQIWESSTVDIRPIIEAVSDDIKHLAAASGTPLYSLSPDANGSAEGATIAKDSNRTKVRDRRERDEPSLASTMSFLFEASGDAVRAERSEIAVIWGPMEYVAKAERAEPARAAKQGGMSQRGINEHIYEMTPEEMELEDLNRRDEAIELSLTEVPRVENRAAGGPALPAEVIAA